MIGCGSIYILAGQALWSLWLITWVAAALWARRTVSAAPGSTFRRQLLIATAGFICLFVESRFRWHVLWTVSGIFGWLLVALVVLGFGFAWWARIHLGPLWSGGIVRREGHRIVDTGPYALVRHPIYTGLMTSAFAFAVIKATPLALLGACLITLGFALKARIEERFLAAELGEADYAAYRARVPMLVPFATAGG
ncbi:methyltransferase family protein [Sphingomonas sp. MMS24-J13]|uniref:methyltransferase family protein n=1 Tax=Sphingomonas sp. MMS24-J13 TaxID=3238686 RepID=UPI00384B556B